MDSGYMRMRRRFRSAPTIYEVQWLFTQAQLATFEGWFDSVAVGGAEPFTISLPNGQGMTSVTARFAAMWEAAPTSCNSYWVVRAQLRVSDRPRYAVMTTEAADTLTTEASNTIILE